MSLCTSIFLVMLFFFTVLINTESLNTNHNTLTKCTTKGPAVISPFSLQNQNCSYPGFKLTCQQNQTIIHFPDYRDLSVKSISYDIKKLNLVDPKSCVHEVFLNLDLSNTPFNYYYLLKSYTYVNCSAKISHTFDEVHCMSGENYHVYVVESIEELPSFCKVVKTKGIPFSYSPYLADNSFGLGFTWDLNGYEDCEVGGEIFNPWIGKVIGFVFILLVAAILISVKIHFSKVVWNYSVANVNEVVGKDIKYYYLEAENNCTDKEILLSV